MKTIAVVGAGLIGSGWASYFLAKGFRVIAVEENSAMRAELQNKILRNWPVMEKAGLVVPGADPRNLLILSDPSELAGHEVDFVQENVKEDIEIKSTILRGIEAAIPRDVIIASSTTGFKPSELQALCIHPERLVIGHPLNPVQLMPVIEVSHGSQESEAAAHRAGEFYQSIGKRVIWLKKEVMGHVMTRLAIALWRESAWLVKSGHASVADVDTAMTEGLGVRLSTAGPHLTFHMGGGDRGYEGYFDWARLLVQKWCNDLQDVTVDAELETMLIEGIKPEVGTLSMAELVQRRDRALVHILGKPAVQIV